MIKLIAIDMDGTLLNDEQQIAKEQIDVLHEAIEKGIQIVLCTGRSLPGVIPFFNQLGLKQEQAYAILNNGCAIHQTKDWQLVDWVQLTKQDLTQLRHIAQQEQVELTLFDEKHFFVLDTPPSQLAIDDAKNVFLVPETITFEEATSGNHRFFKAMFMAEPQRLDTFELTYKQTLSNQFSVVRSQTMILEMLPNHATKASGLEQLAKKLNILPEEIMTIGDGNNDIEMLQFAGIGVAMGNGTPLAKAAADVITDTNNQHGVAKAIRQYAFH